MALPGFYLWEVPGKRASVQISLDVVDRLQQDVMRGFGAVPKRGAEIGGILLGVVEKGSSVVRVGDYEMVPIEYKRGPSYVLSPEDAEVFDGALRELGSDSGMRPVGYFRSHTRDGVGLGEEDLDLLSRDFPQPDAIVLLIRPFGTKPSIAGFYFRENGKFQSGPPLLEFPFRRKDLAPDEAVPAAPLPDRPRVPAPPPRAIPRTDPDRPEEQPGEQVLGQQAKRWPLQSPPSNEAEVADPMDTFEASGFVAKRPKSGKRRRLLWLPLSFIFLLIGILLGFLAALSMRLSDPYNVSLRVKQQGSDLQVTWNRQSQAIRTAQRGVLTIEDGSFTRPTNVGTSELQSGSVVVYHPVTNHVRFRLDLFLKDSDSLSETIDWKQ